MHNDVAHLTSTLTATLERFERASWRCRPEYAQRVRDHILTKLQDLGADVPIIVPLDDVDEHEPAFLQVDDPADPVPVPTLSVLILGEGTLEETVVPLDDALTVGRGGQNDMKLSGDNKVSRYHCRFIRNEQEIWLVDLNSANGTLVNGEMLTPELPRRLFGGEELIVGNTFLRFRTL